MKLGALLVDLENLYLSLKAEYAEADELTVTVLQNLRVHLETELHISPVVGRAYAPFDFSSTRDLINDLALMGISPIHVLAKASKNSADLMLAIDCMELLFRREDISALVIVGGDRDYIPIVERIRQNARDVLIVCPRHSMSGDLLTIIGTGAYLDAITLLPAEKRTPKRWKAERSTIIAREEPKRKTATDRAETSRPISREAVQSIPATLEEFELTVNDSHEVEDLKKCMSLILEYQRSRNVKEIWLGPFFRVMNDAFPLKNNSERKALITELEEYQAVEIVQHPRNDEGGTYSALRVNWKHPLVVSVNP